MRKSEIKKLKEKIEALEDKLYNTKFYVSELHSKKTINAFGGNYETPFAERIYELEVVVRGCEDRIGGIEEDIKKIMDFLGAEFHHEEAKFYVRKKDESEV